MKPLLFILIILLISCNSHTTKPAKLSTRDSIFAVANFDTSVVYDEPCCLLYRGKPLFTIGQNIKDLNPNFTHRFDPNGIYARYDSIVTDHVSTDAFFTDDLSTGSVAGAIYFSSDTKGRIFAVNGSWLINGFLVDTSGMEIIDHMTSKFFPCFPTDLKGVYASEKKHKNFTEQFYLYVLPYKADSGSRYATHWGLDYSVKLVNEESKEAMPKK